ncbi:MAG: relaxase/mobilization nuclease domain-containing protein [Clostridia bacterium]|nr:relaxase/mobilization nuclease domain-containing protein [Clostridia bacterium]
MAVVESIPEKNQTPSAQKGVLDYCMQPSKTFDEDEQLAYISGYNCIPEQANESFLATQKIFGHEPDGVRFYHFVQSFKIGENISPQEANEIGMELAKIFENREVIVATHIDQDHLHNHIVVCSYDLESGLKLHYNQYFLSDLRQKSDEICQAHGLNVLKKYNPNVKSQRLGPKEYRAAMNGNSWKMALRVAIDFCMTRATNKDEFQREMKKLGYDMVWTPERKYITYICPTQNGKECRVRDIKLNDEKYLKENMEHEFRIRTEVYGQAQGAEYSSGTARSDGRNGTGAQGGAGDSDGTDQRRGMDAANRNCTQNGGSVSPAVGAESRFEGISGELRHGDEEGGRGAERGDGGSSTQGDEGSYRTGWESERESFRSYRQKNSSGRGTVVAPTRTHSSPDNIGVALMGARGLGNLTSLFEDGEKSEEEKRQREARNAGEAVGAVVGFGIGAVVELTQQKPTPTDDVDDGEDEGFEISM